MISTGSATGSSGSVFSWINIIGKRDFFVFAWTILATHVPSFYDELSLFVGQLGSAVFSSAMLWIWYLALTHLAQEGIRFGRKITCSAAKSPKDRSEITPIAV